MAETIRKKLLEFRQSHAIVIGVNYYPYALGHLKTALEDATEIAKILKEKQEFDNVLLMTDPTQTQILELLDWLKNPESEKQIAFSSVPETPEGERLKSKIGSEALPTPKEWVIKPGKEDSVLFYFAGHGLPNPASEERAGYLAPSDTKKNHKEEYTNLVAMDQVYAAFKALKCHHTLLILDCCFAGQFRFAESSLFRGKLKDLNRILDRPRFLKYKHSRAWQVLASTAPNKKALDTFAPLGKRDFPDEKHSPFAKTLIDALGGKAEDIDGAIIADRLGDYTREKVGNLFSKVGLESQDPRLIQMEEHRAGEFVFFKEGFQMSDLEKRDPENPYPGLLPYEPPKAGKKWFYGRDEEIAEVLDKLNTLPVLVITGPSAVGKSSLVKAGVLPKLNQQLTDSETPFELLSLRPGAKPWSGKEVRCKKEVNGKEVEGIRYHSGLKALCLSQAKEELPEHPSIPELLASLDPGKSPKKLLLLIDQCEELFTSQPAENEMEDFTKVLLELVDLAEKSKLEAEDSGILRIILTIRSDFEWELERAPLGQALKTKGPGTHYPLFRLSPMREQLREVLLGPTDEEFLEFEEGLLDQILKDLNYVPAALPLLSLSMQKLIDKALNDGAPRDRMGDPTRIITTEMYLGLGGEIGGIKGVLSTIAHEVYRSLAAHSVSAESSQNTTTTQTHLGLGGIIGRIKDALDWNSDEDKESIVVPSDLAKSPENSSTEEISDPTEQVSTPAESPAQKTMRKIVLRLIQPNEGSLTRRRVYISSYGGKELWNELDFLNDEDDEMVKDVLGKLTETQLIVRGRDMNNDWEYIELAHDFLITEWDTCSQWVKDFGYGNLILQRQLWNAVVELKKNNENEDYLWSKHPKLTSTITSVMTASRDILFQKEPGSLGHAINHLIGKELEGKDRGDFKTLLRNWTATGETPNLDAFIISGVSSKLLEVFLQYGNHWLNQFEVSFVRQSWKDRIKDFLELKEQKERIIHEVMNSTWRAATLLDDEHFGYWKGVRELYGSINFLIDLKKISSIANLKVFISGPHEDDFNLSSDEFGYYNPDFLIWVKKYAIPAKNDSILRNLTMPFYMKYLKSTARIYYNTYKYVKKNTQIFPEMAEAYTKKLSSDSSVNTFQFSLDYFEDFNLNETVSAAFWFRRWMDGTIEHFKEILVKLLNTYEPLWLSAIEKSSNSPEIYKKEIEEKNKQLVSYLEDNLEKVTQLSIKNNNQFYFLESVYQAYNHLFSLKVLQSFLPVPVFIGGPHDEELNLKSQYDFGQYNPEFLRWLRRWLEEKKEFLDYPVLKRLTGLFYENNIRELVRLHYWACMYLEENEAERENFIRYYKRTIKGLKSSDIKNTNAWREVEYSTGSYSILREGDKKQSNALGFWVRRHINGTANEFKKLLNEVLKSFDGEWLNEQETGD